MASFLRFLDHTQRCTTVGRNPLDEWSAHRRDLYRTIHNTHNRQTSMLPVGFEPTILASERPQTYALDCAATGTGTSSLLAWNIFLSTPFSNTPSLHSFLCASDQVSHPHKTTDKITVLYTLIFIFLDSGRQKILHQMMASICSLQSALNSFLNGIWIC